MSRTEQVSAFVFRPSEGLDAAEYLALRRVPERGGFWQGVTGGLDDIDHAGTINTVNQKGTRHAAGAIREVGEEIGLDVVRVHETGYNFSFTDPNDGMLVEHVVAVEVEPGSNPTLSDEHDGAFWVNNPDMRSLVGAKWPENVVGFDRAHAEVAKKYPGMPTSTFGINGWSLVIEKPDAIELGIQDEIRRKLRAVGLRTILSIEGVQLSPEMVDGIWIPPKIRDPWYHATIDYMMRTPVNVQLMHGNNATEKVLVLKQKLRRKYDKNYRDDDTAPVEKRVESLLHGSDRMEELARQALLFFQQQTIYEAVQNEAQSN